jgi:hypothetical protein
MGTDCAITRSMLIEAANILDSLPGSMLDYLPTDGAAGDALVAALEADRVRLVAAIRNTECANARAV